MISAIRFAPEKAGEVLRGIRKFNRMRMIDVSNALGLSAESTISHYECGRRRISLPTLSALANLYGYDVEIRLIKRE